MPVVVLCESVSVSLVPFVSVKPNVVPVVSVCPKVIPFVSVKPRLVPSDWLNPWLNDKLTLSVSFWPKLNVCFNRGES